MKTLKFLQNMLIISLKLTSDKHLTGDNIFAYLNIKMK